MYGFEKVHGSNVCFVTNGDEFGWCKRTSALCPKYNFPGIESVCERYSDILKMAVQDICKSDKKRFPTGTVFYLYGEMFGGSFEHPEIPVAQGAKKIQKGISYTPNNEFLVFDMMYKLPVDNDSLVESVPLNYMTVEEMLHFCVSFQIPHIPIYSKAIGVHDLEELLKLECHTKTEIHQLFNLPIPHRGEWAEGLVLRPNKTFFLPSGSRAIIKFKDAFFSEVSKEKDPVIVTEVTENIKNGSVAIQDYVTQNRYDTLVSKYGRGTQEAGRNAKDGRSLSRMIGLYTQDVMKDFEKDYPDKYTPSEMEAIIHIVKSHCIVGKVKNWFRQQAEEDETETTDATEIAGHS